MWSEDEVIAAWPIPPRVRTPGRHDQCV